MLLTVRPQHRRLVHAAARAMLNAHTLLARLRTARLNPKPLGPGGAVVRAFSETGCEEDPQAVADV